MRLIDADALIAWIKGSQQMTSKMKCVIAKIETMPDAVSVVRCEDCKRSEGCDQMVLISEIYNEVEEAEPITYCSYGERKESE